MAILVIKAREAETRALRSTLQDGGFKDVAVAHSIGEALTTLAAAHTIDLILMATLIPDMDGIAACAIFKSTPAFATIPVIMLASAHASAELAASLDAGAHDYIVEPFHPQELAARVRAALRLKHEIDARRARERELEELTTQLEREKEELTELTGEDSMTKLANKRRFEFVLRRDFRSAVRAQAPLGVLMIDVDHFKLYNDHHGHRAGDLCLKLVANQIKHTLRRSTDTAARYGGEEFSVILPDTHVAGVRAVCERIRDSIERLEIPHPTSPTAPSVTVSIGAICHIPQADESDGQMVAAADAELYRIKHTSRNAFSLTTDIIRHEARKEERRPPTAANES